MSVCSNHYVFSISEILRLYGTCEFRRTHIYVCVFRLYASTCVSVRVWQSALTTLLLKAVNRNRELYFVDCRSAKMSRYCLHINLGQREHMPSSSAQWLFCNLVQEKQYRPVQPKKKKKPLGIIHPITQVIYLTLFFSSPSPSNMFIVGWP